MSLRHDGSGNGRRAGRSLRFETLDSRQMLASDLELVKDIRVGEASSAPHEMVQVGSTLFFVATDGVAGAELWKSDGTAAGTVRVKDIRPGPEGSNSRFLTNVNGTLYFSANDGVTGHDLWKSDGTEAGTVKFKDISDVLTLPPTLSRLTNVNGTLFFAAGDNTSFPLLWKSDGTASGTVRLSANANLTFTQNFVNIGGLLYFTASNAANGHELWKSNGQVNGTVVVRDIRPGTLGSDPQSLINVGGTLHFSANDGTNGRALWKTDGTSTSTLLVKTFAGGLQSDYLSPTNVGGTLYFWHQRELWKSDGTSAGTMSFTSLFFEGGLPFRNIAVSLPRAVENTLYFVTSDGSSGSALWKTDGSAAGTAKVKDVSVRINTNTNPLAITMWDVKGTLYFAASDGANGTELWRSDGSELGTVLVRDLYAGPESSNPSLLTVVGDRLFFRSTTPAAGQELYSLSLATPPATPGDYNRNGIVDLADFEVWRKDFGSAINLAADGNNDGVIDAADYSYWRTRYNVTPAPIAASPARRSPFVQPVASATVAVSAVSSTQRDLLIASRDAAFAELGDEPTVTSKPTRIAASPARRR